MVTAALLHRLAYADGPVRAQAFADLAAAAGDPAAYQVVVQTLATTPDDRVAFWCLDALVKHFGPLLAADAPRVIPLLLHQLVQPQAPVADRAAWALSTAGPASVPALLAAVHRAQDPAHRVAYLAALRQSYHLPDHAPAVLACLAEQLQDPFDDVRYWAMVVSMDVSPLRPAIHRPALPAAAFEPLFRAVLPVAEEFITRRQDEFASRYRDLILSHWHQDPNR